MLPPRARRYCRRRDRLRRDRHRREQQHRAWIAEDASGGLAGILVLDGPWVDQLYVEPTLTGRGIGTALLNLAKRERRDGLRLWTFASNPGAQRFYERHGFVATHRTDGRDNEERAPDILYVWRGEEAVPVRGVRAS